MIKKIFGTDGARGVANREPITVETALQLGRAAGHIFKRDDRRHSLVIGKDPRLSGYMLEAALVAGICSMGVDVLQVGPLPTPGVAFITRSLRADAGVMISASHNPFEDNGIKFFTPEGLKLPEGMERRMEEIIYTRELHHYRPMALDVGRAYRIDDALGRYVEFVKMSFPKGMMLDGMKLVVDCGNGAAYKAAPHVMQELGAEITVLHQEPNGTNINYQCGALYPQNMMEVVRETGADAGMSFDGDADRVIFSDEKGNRIDGDFIMAIAACDLFACKESNKILVSTIMSNMALEKLVQSWGGKFIRTNVGDRFVVGEMIRTGALIGGEQSGHIVFSEYNTTGDGLISALQILQIMRRTGKSLSKLAKILKKYPQVLINVPVSKKTPLGKIPRVVIETEKAKKELANNGRLSLRYSGTQKLARVMLEGKDEKLINKLAEHLAEVIQKEVGEPGELWEKQSDKTGS